MSEGPAISTYLRNLAVLWVVRGAEVLDAGELEKYWLNDHIVVKLGEREGAAATALPRFPNNSSKVPIST